LKEKTSAAITSQVVVYYFKHQVCKHRIKEGPFQANDRARWKLSVSESVIRMSIGT